MVAHLLSKSSFLGKAAALSALILVLSPAREAVAESKTPGAPAKPSEVGDAARANEPTGPLDTAMPRESESNGRLGASGAPLAAFSGQKADAPEGVEIEDAVEPAVPEKIRHQVEKFASFDPEKYRCAEFQKDLEHSDPKAERALIWAHGYWSAQYGPDEMGALDPTTLGHLANDFSMFCRDHHTDSFSNAAFEITGK